MVRKALDSPRLRRQTRPSRTSVVRRVEGKKKRGKVKKMRGKPVIEE
jgi:ribosome-associated protein